MTLSIDEAKKIVKKRYPDATAWRAVDKKTYGIVVDSRDNPLLEKTEAAAWIAAANRIKKRRLA